MLMSERGGVERRAGRVQARSQVQSVAIKDNHHTVTVSHRPVLYVAFNFVTVTHRPVKSFFLCCVDLINRTGAIHDHDDERSLHSGTLGHRLKLRRKMFMDYLFSLTNKK